LLLLMRKGEPEMVSVESSIPEGDGVVVVVLRGELDAAKVAAMHPGWYRAGRQALHSRPRHHRHLAGCPPQARRLIQQP
jgi:hypothetical protein